MLGAIFDTAKATDFSADNIGVPPQVESALREIWVREGLCLVNAMHILAGTSIRTVRCETAE